MSVEYEISQRNSAFLLFENLDKSTWKKTLSDSRSAYTSLREHFLRDIDHPDDLSAIDPLTDDESSPWNILRLDEDLRAEIFQDVERCMPENMYFREPSTQAMLLDILFIFCKLNKDLSYRQGMHEVLAPILWVISRDVIDPESLRQDSELHSVVDDLMLANFSEKYVEHDTFTLFAIIMQTVKSFYEVGSTELPPVPAPSNNSSIVERSKRIHEDYLRKADLELAEHLTAIEVLPQIFLIKWIRLLFGREFPFDEVLSLWDILFAEDPTLNLVDLICVSMLLRIRWQLIEADYSAALTLLLRYPTPPHPEGPPSLVEDALYLRDHNLPDGGPHLILKYSGKLPAPPLEAPKLSDSFAGRFSKKGRRIRQRKHDSQRSPESPRRSPGWFLQDQGGIEGILQEAARGVYSRGEKWGLARALRGAVQGLQSGNSSPRRLPDGSRWSLDQGKHVTDDASHLATNLHDLEQRNQVLAKLLDSAMEDLWVQQRNFTKDNADAAADALSLVIAKVQFVQVNLENSMNASPLDSSTEEVLEKIESAPSPESTAHDKGSDTNHASPAVADREPARSPDQDTGQIQDGTIVSSEPMAESTAVATSLNFPIHPTDSDPQKSHHDGAPVTSFPFHHPRPSLAQSSFSWMLGEDQRRSSFVSASPFPSEKRNAREKARFLFGDDQVEGSKGAHGSKGKETREEADDEAISLGDLTMGAREQ
ncbi:hypothetical protein MMC07_008291 [Pseudocyphellaria aurata]|nr:hypothetical protein [Pseudocyphellaria aurata]